MKDEINKGKELFKKEHKLLLNDYLDEKISLSQFRRKIEELSSWKNLYYKNMMK